MRNTNNLQLKSKEWHPELLLGEHDFTGINLYDMCMIPKAFPLAL